ncbi:hypothetical protein HJFPF1_10732 [Paramyrothecium foliicola]|nr:hypothetical protein HJFPF1_10732 [Paramyrothecium foliicola]
MTLSNPKTLGCGCIDRTNAWFSYEDDAVFCADCGITTRTGEEQETTMLSDKDVYLAFRPAKAFRKKRAGGLSEETIRNVIHKRKDLVCVQSLIQEYGMERLCATVKALLQAGVFSSEAEAKKHFPDVFGESQTDDCANALEKNEPASGEDKMLDENDFARADDERTNNKELAGPECGVSGPAAILQSQVGVTGVCESADKEMTGFDMQAQSMDAATCPRKTAHNIEANNMEVPTVVPFDAHHSLMVTLQSWLEHGLFDYGKKELQELMQRRNWRYAQQIELQ